MSKPIILSMVKWDELLEKLCEDYPRSVMMLSYKMKEVLGFTVRRHEEWFESIGHSSKYHVQTIHLDFYNEPKRTMFMLKYSEYLDKSGNTKLDIHVI